MNTHILDVGIAPWTLFQTDSYIPHGHCYLWQTPLVWLHATSDILTAIAYYSIPLILLYFLSKRKDIAFPKIILLFSSFILLCGSTHILDVITLWLPVYWLSGAIKAITAIVSVITVFELIHFVPQALSLKSPQELELLNEELNKQIKEREASDLALRELNRNLEERVNERIAELAQINQQLEREIQDRQAAQIESQEAQHFSKRIADLTPNIIHIYDIQEDRTIYSNQSIAEVLGYHPEAVHEKQDSFFTQQIHPEDLPLIKEAIHNLQGLPDDTYLDVEYRMRDSGGKWRWMHSRKTIFERDNTGKVKQYISVVADIMGRKEAEISLMQVNQELAQRVQELEVRTIELIQMGQMTDFLQSCLSVQEAEKALSDLLHPLFSDCAGAIYSLHSSRNYLDVVANWGEDIESEQWITPDDCWALRRGVSHSSSPQTPNLYCHHIHHQDHLSPTTLCIPMVAQGETLGLLYLNFHHVTNLTSPRQRLAETVAKQIAITLANLKLRETLQYQSFRDGLTGLYNRRYLDTSFERELHRCRRNNEPLSIFVIDIDHFKHFNDAYGHEAGDLVLQNLGNLLRRRIRASDIACRYGGEELVLLLPGMSLTSALPFAEKICGDVRHLVIPHHHAELKGITVSIGVASYPNHGQEAEQLFRQADQALYRAKQEGRDRIVSLDADKLI